MVTTQVESFWLKKTLFPLSFGYFFRYSDAIPKKMSLV